MWGHVVATADEDFGPLGNNTDFATFPQLPSDWLQIQAFANPVLTDEGNLYEKEALRWLALSHARYLCRASGRVHRLLACGSTIKHNAKFVSVHQTLGARAKVTGVCRCGQTLVCPVCAPRASAYRAAEVADGYQNAVGMGWDAYHVILTAPHYNDSSLMDEALWWRDSWRWAFGKGMVSAQVKADWLGYVNAAEMTYSERSGWHYHRHILLYVKPDTGPLAICMMRARWLAAIRRGHRDNGGIDQFAFRAEPCVSKGISYYVAKIGAEVASHTTKENNSPLAILGAAAMDSKTADRWLEALDVCSSLKIGSCRWSRGLRPALNLPPERSDEEIAEDCIEAKDLTLGQLTGDQWRRIIKDRLEYQFLQIANKGLNAANEFLANNELGQLLTNNEIANLTHTKQ